MRLLKSDVSLIQRLPFYYGWIILGVGTLGFFAAGPGQIFTISMFVDPMIRETGWSRSMISGVYTGGTFTAALAMPFVGRLVDRLGARVMLISVGALFGLACLWMSSVNHALGLYVGFVGIRGFGQGAFLVIPSTLVALWFIRLRGRAMTVLVWGGLAASAAIFPPFAQLLISSFGWRIAWVWLAVAAWILIIPPAAIFVRRTPESVGLKPDGADIPSSLSKISAKWNDPELSWTLGEAMHTRSFWLLLILPAATSVCTAGLVFHQVSYFTSQGFSVQTAAGALSVFGVFFAIGALVGGVLVNRVVGRVLLSGILGLCFGAIAWLLFVVTSNWQAAVYGAMLGTVNGAITVVGPVVWATYYGRRYIGSILGVVTTSIVAAAAFGPLLLGVAYDMYGGYEEGVMALAVIPAVSTVGILFAKPPVYQNRAS